MNRENRWMQRIRMKARPMWCKVFLIPECGKFLHVESEIPGFRIQNSGKGIRNSANDWKLESRFQWESIRNPVPGIWNPQGGSVLDYLTWNQTANCGWYTWQVKYENNVTEERLLLRVVKRLDCKCSISWFTQLTWQVWRWQGEAALRVTQQAMLQIFPTNAWP